MESERVTLIVETPDGVIFHRLPHALPLRGDLPPGSAAEEATRDAAAVWGMPDFIYRPIRRSHGSGTRELGDALMIVGNLGVVIQVKSRAKMTTDDLREQRWLTKSVAKALSQADGTIRAMKQGRVELANGRGRRVQVDGQTLRWVSVVIIDHPSPAEIAPEISRSRNPAVVLSRADWEFLFFQLKSSRAVAAYVHRVSGESIDAGTEAVRFYQLANADHETEPEPLDPRLESWGLGRRLSSPALPLIPPEDSEEQAHRILRIVFEDIATSGGPSAINEHERLNVLAQLDRLPVVDRAQIGEFILDGLRAGAGITGDEVQWRFRSMVGTLQEDGDPTHLCFCVCSRPGEDIRNGFSTWVQLRHHELYELLVQDFTTVGILVTPRRDGIRAWDTTMVAATGNLLLDEESLTAFRSLWNNKSLVQRW